MAQYLDAEVLAGAIRHLERDLDLHTGPVEVKGKPVDAAWRTQVQHSDQLSASFSRYSTKRKGKSIALPRVDAHAT